MWRTTSGFIVVRESAMLAHRDITAAYEKWRTQRAAKDADLCFEIVARDDIPVRE